MRVLLALLTLAVAGCDTVRPDVVALDDVLVVDVVAADPAVLPALTFVTEGAPGCATPVAYRTRVSRDVLTVEVDGLEVPTGPTCRAFIPSSFAVAVPTTTASALDVEVRHRGETDRYEVRYADGGLELVPVRTSATRAGPR
ncbi:hypothetical protein [Rubrivirga sp. IMCC45206]|uniref:hypothetical protein n=1 Tax=Rubrivirga sp. IMCC45206 TaxID=3391614 RepID=UPI00398FF1F8